MSLHLWFAFVLASAALVAIPGPTVIMTISHALAHGRRSILVTVPGVMLADLIAMSVSLAGAGAILSASATLFTVLKLAGAAYLVWLGVKLWRAEGSLAVMEAAATGSKDSMATLFWRAFTVTVLNPKGIVFFIAFVPQFVSPEAPVLPQFALLVASFVIIAAISVTCWSMLAGELRSRVTRPGVLKGMNRTGAALLIGAGALTAFARRVHS
jgi:threonine/homoserine/homoserine lactone efflux protein